MVLPEIKLGRWTSMPTRFSGSRTPATTSRAALQQAIQGMVGLPGRLQTARLFSNPDLAWKYRPGGRADARELAEGIIDELSAILTDAQKKCLAERMGPPLAAPLPMLPISIRPARAALPGARGRVQPFAFPAGFIAFPSFISPGSPRQGFERWIGLGQIALRDFQPGLGLLSQESVREELKLTAEQVWEHVPLGGDTAELQKAAQLSSINGSLPHSLTRYPAIGAAIYDPAAGPHAIHFRIQ